MTLKNAYLRGNTIIYQRAVPSKLRNRYPGATIKHDLKTADVAIAARKVTELNRRYEAEWAGLLAAPESSPKALKVHAAALLRTFGLTPGDTDSPAADVFFDKLEDQRQRHAAGDRETYESADFADYLPAIEVEALKALKGQQLPVLSDALDLHLSLHKKSTNEKFVTYQRRAFGTLMAATGDKAIKEFSRDDARTYIATALKAGASTGTVRRRLGAMSAVFTTWRLEKDKGFANPFERLSMANEGKDKKARVPFNPATLSDLYVRCRQKDDDLRWLLSILADTGARLAECTGLALSDICFLGFGFDSLNLQRLDSRNTCASLIEEPGKQRRRRLIAGSCLGRTTAEAIADARACGVNTDYLTNGRPQYFVNGDCLQTLRETLILG